MCLVCEGRVQDFWGQMAVGQSFMTPDRIQGVPFEISQVGPASIRIAPQDITISRAAFDTTLTYLFHNGHGMDNPCLVGSSNSPAGSGALCASARGLNGNVRCINYILPIMQGWGVVGIHGGRNNSTWIITDPV
jgi:hypothetical protein